VVTLMAMEVSLIDMTSAVKQERTGQFKRVISAINEACKVPL
jgi:hypothetical protein